MGYNYGMYHVIGQFRAGQEGTEYRMGKDKVQDRMGQGGWNGIEQDRMG